MLRALALSALLLPSVLAAQSFTYGTPNVPEFSPAFPEQTRAPLTDSGMDLRVDVLATDLVRPWGVDQLPDGSLIVTERPGRLRHVAPDGTLSDPIAGLPELVAQRQGGLLDVTLSPDFASDRLVFLTYSKPMGSGRTTIAAARGRLSQDHRRLEDVRDIFVGGPASPSPMHYGSRVLFAPDGNVFVTTGEHSSRQERRFAQHVDKSHGKVIRVTPDGTVPPDNPSFDDPKALPQLYTFGHRNVQGAAIRPGTSQLWTIEHGPRGGDELNLITPGQNYGWPIVSYGENYNGASIGNGISDHAGNGFAEPRYYWDPVIAPGGMTFYDGTLFDAWQGDLFIAALAGRGIVRLRLQGDTIIEEERLLRNLGRVRDVMVAQDGALIAATDGDGTLVRITPR